jgi:hypothetical protein
LPLRAFNGAADTSYKLDAEVVDTQPAGDVDILLDGIPQAAAWLTGVAEHERDQSVGRVLPSHVHSSHHRV